MKFHESIFGKQVHFFGKQVHEDIYLLPGKYLLTSRKIESAVPKRCTCFPKSALAWTYYWHPSHIHIYLHFLGSKYTFSRRIICTVFGKQVHFPKIPWFFTCFPKKCTCFPKNYYFGTASRLCREYVLRSSNLKHCWWAHGPWPMAQPSRVCLTNVWP